MWKPKLTKLDVRALPLTPTEGFLLSRLDGHTTLAQLASFTGQPLEVVTQTLSKLVEVGAVEPDAHAAPPPPPPVVAPEPVAEAPLEPDASDDLNADAPEEDEATSKTHLALFREKLHPLSEDQRTKLGQTAEEPELSALCFDPLPAVIRAVLTNPKRGFVHARLIAAHHQNATGLEFLFSHAELLRDVQVQRMLWRNPQLNDAQLRRLTQHKRLLELWKLSINREASTKTRTGSAKALRTRFSSTASEEKVELILTSEGRALGSLSGMPLDGRTTALLCSRTYASLTLVQNLAQWSSAPPPLIAHLLKQPIVARQPQLRAMLARHPNAPPSARQK